LTNSSAAHTSSTVSVAARAAAASTRGPSPPTPSADLVLPAHGFWTKQERQEHINALELRAVHLGIAAFEDHLRGTAVDLYTDNQVVAHIINSGASRSSALMSHLRLLHHYVQAANIEVFGRARWLPSATNATADRLSRLSDPGGWSVDHAVFRILDRWWGPHTIDLFASEHNAQLARFFTRYPHRDSAGCDALLQSWSTEVVWACPPFGLLFRTISKLQRDGAHGTLVAPVWPTAPWWPALKRMTVDRFDLISGTEVLASPSCLDDSEPFRNTAWTLAAFRVDCRRRL
jgi:hypothetical protein